ncbi:NAKD2 kinase, partial [Atractosteus spatula]|nr:NAKD2 kinase [Atractosteus spatula]
MSYRKLLGFLSGVKPTVSCVRGVFSGASHGSAGFTPAKVAVVTKTTRYEFEQQRYRCAGLSEEDLKHLLAMKGSSYSGLLERHNIHTRNVQHVVDSLRKEGMEVRVVKRREYDEETVRWADAIVSAGGDGTMLLVASKVLDKHKPVLGVNTDPERKPTLNHCASLKMLKTILVQADIPCPLPHLSCSYSLVLALRRWQWRQRIRIYLEGTGINPTPVDLHEQQLSLEQHNKAHRTSAGSGLNEEPESKSGPHLLPVRGLNEVFIGESLSSRARFKSFNTRLPFSLHRASYYEISVDDGPWEKQKSSGLNVCTGTGSKAWSYNINKLVTQAVEDVLKIGKTQIGLDIPLNRNFIEKVTDEYNESLTFSPEESRLFFSVREPIVNRVFSSSRQRGFTTKVCVRSRCWDACMVVDGGTSFEFNDGAIATISMDADDALRTVVLRD